MPGGKICKRALQADCSRACDCEDSLEAKGMLYVIAGFGERTATRGVHVFGDQFVGFLETDEQRVVDLERIAKGGAPAFSECRNSYVECLRPRGQTIHPSLRAGRLSPELRPLSLRGCNLLEGVTLFLKWGFP